MVLYLFGIGIVIAASIVFPCDAGKNYRLTKNSYLIIKANKTLYKLENSTMNSYLKHIDYECVQIKMDHTFYILNFFCEVNQRNFDNF